MMKKTLSIAGLDPSGGAGILADTKVFNQFGVCGLGVATAITYQNENFFEGLQWLSVNQITDQIEAIFGDSLIGSVKIGIVESLDLLSEILNLIHRFRGEPIVIWDPIIKSSTGFTFLKKINKKSLLEVLTKVNVITPNAKEFSLIKEVLGMEPEELLELTNVILKGGHMDGDNSIDTFYRKGKAPLTIANPRLRGVSKHGTGCAFSSAYAASIAKGMDELNAFEMANQYLNKLLQTGEGKSSAHHQVDMSFFEMKMEELK